MGGGAPVCVILLDARVPPLAGGATSPDAFRARLEELVEPDGRLPPWTSWWPAQVLTELLPDPVQRNRISEECPRVPIGWSDGLPEVDPAWERLPIGYLQRSMAYADQADLAEEQGWVTSRSDGSHLDCATEPADVAAAVLRALTELRTRAGPPGRGPAVGCIGGGLSNPPR